MHFKLRTREAVLFREPIALTVEPFDPPAGPQTSWGTATASTGGIITTTYNNLTLWRVLASVIAGDSIMHVVLHTAGDPEEAILVHGAIADNIDVTGGDVRKHIHEAMQAAWVQHNLQKEVDNGAAFSPGD